jgi:hypothetical protein
MGQKEVWVRKRYGSERGMGQEEVWDTGYNLLIMERKRAASMPP